MPERAILRREITRIVAAPLEQATRYEFVVSVERGTSNETDGMPTIAARLVVFLGRGLLALASRFLELLEEAQERLHHGWTREAADHHVACWGTDQCAVCRRYCDIL